jgi:hypothetical protein
MRLSGVIAALLVIAPLGVGTAAAQPFEGQTWWGGRPNMPPAPWCLHLKSGFDHVEEDCSFMSFRACQFALGNANNGFCTQSYAYAGRPPAPPRKSKKKRRAQY